MTYIQTCQRCHQPWNGFDFVCNSCRQIEAIEKQTQQIRNNQPSMFPPIDLSEFRNDDSNLSQRDKDLGKPWWK